MVRLRLLSALILSVAVDAFHQPQPTGTKSTQLSFQLQPQPTRTTLTQHSSTTADASFQHAAELVSGGIAWNSLVGQADRAFRLGIQLEKNGQARKASASFHEAATLYQCFLDSKKEFGHVTSLREEECTAILAYACLRLGFLSLDALGEAKAAVRLYKEGSHPLVGVI